MLHLQYIFFECLGIHLLSIQLQTVYGGIPLLSTGASLKDTQINLADLWEEAKPIRYYKYVIIVYSRAVESRMDVRRKDVKDLEQLENMKAASWTWNSNDIATKYSKLMEVAKSVLQDFHNAIVTKKDSLSFTQKEFYYRALIWIEVKMRLPNNDGQSEKVQSVHQSFKEMIKSFHLPEVAENYLPEMYTEGSSLDIIKQAENVFQVDSLKNFGIYEDAAIDLMVKIKSDGVGSIKLGNFEKIQPDDYELILSDINPEKIFEKFDNRSFEMLMYMDKAFYLQENKFYEFQPLSVEDYRMSTAASDIERWKYALIFLYRKIRDTLISLLTIGDESLLTFLDSFLGHNECRNLRIQCLTYFHTRILPTVSYIMKSVSYTDTESITRKVYCARVLAWFHYTLPKDEHLSIRTPSILVENEDETYTLQHTYQYVKNILDEEVKNNKLIKMFSLDVEKGVAAIDSWNDLTSLGNEEEAILELFLDFMKKKQQRDLDEKDNNLKEENCLEEEKEETDPKEEKKEDCLEEEEKEETDGKIEINEETHPKEEEKENNGPKERKNRWGKVLEKVCSLRPPSIQITMRRFPFCTSDRGATENEEENRPKEGETDLIKPNVKRGIKQEIYENMLQKVERRSFTSKFLLEPYQMLMYMDYEFYHQNHDNLNFQRISPDNSNFQAMEGDDLKSWKYAMIHLYRRVEHIYLGDAQVDSENTKLLEYLSDKNDPENLRLSCVAFLCVHTLKEIHERIQAAGFTTQREKTSTIIPKLEIVDQMYEKNNKGEETGDNPHPSPEVMATFQEILDVIRNDPKYKDKPQGNAFKPLIKELKRKIILRSNLDASAMEEESSDETTETEETVPPSVSDGNNENNSTDKASWYAPVTRRIAQITKLVGFS